jgi:hypothetical protein
MNEKLFYVPYRDAINASFSMPMALKIALEAIDQRRLTIREVCDYLKRSLPGLKVEVREGFILGVWKTYNDGSRPPESFMHPDKGLYVLIEKPGDATHFAPLIRFRDI